METTLDRVQLPPATDQASADRVAAIYEQFLKDRSVRHPASPASAQLAFFNQFFHGQLLRPPSFPPPVIDAAAEIKGKLEQAALAESQNADQPAPQMSAAAFFGRAIGALARSPFDAIKSLARPFPDDTAPSGASTQNFVGAAKAAEFEQAQAGSDGAQKSLQEALKAFDASSAEHLKPATDRVQAACDAIVGAMHQEIKTMHAGAEAGAAVKQDAALETMNARNLQTDKMFKKSVEKATESGDLAKVKALQDQMKSFAERVTEMIKKFFAGLASALGMKSRTAPAP